MQRALSIAAGGMKAQQMVIDVLSHNLANVNTPAFKKSRVFSEDVAYQTQTFGGAGFGTAEQTVQIGLGARVRQVSRDCSQGDLNQTGGTYDLAIDGPGFLRVSTPEREELYLRAGNLRLDAEGKLVTQAGYEVDPGIVIPANAEKVTIAEDGTVSVLEAGQDAATVAGKLTLVRFQNPEQLMAIGGSLYRGTEEAGEPEEVTAGSSGAGRILQGSLENSNVDIVEEMVALVAGQRAYEINSKVIQAVDQMMQSQTALR
jgi:flagellar basal-body rod protein FlgG